MTEEQTNWKPGAIVNGHILVDGEGWVPLAEHARRLRDAGAPPQSPPRSAASQPLFDPFTGERLRPDPAPAGAQLTLDDPLPPAATDVGQLSDPALTSHGSPSRNALLVIAGIIVLALLAAGVWYVVGPMARKSDAKKAEVACKQALRDTYDDLRGIDSRLDVGMIEADYTTLVGQAQVDFDRIDGTVATGGSCAAYTQLDQALTQYTAASQYWNGCIADYSCTVSETELNGWWSTASDELDTIDSAGISSLASSGT